MRHLYILFLFALLAGCDHDRSFPDTAVPVQIVPSLDHVAPGGTRVIDQTWQSNDVVGVSIDNRTTFKTYKPSGTLPSTSVTLIPMVDPLYYPTNDDEVTFTAFCPYKAPVGDVVTYDAFTDQSTPAKMQAVDLIYHYGAKGRRSTATTAVNMSFQHKFSKVVITATRGANVSEDLNNLTMTLTGMPTSTTFDLSTGLPGTAGTPGTITPEHYNKGTATTVARAIIAPHTGIANRTITFAVGSLNYSYPIPAGFEFETGKEYTFDFTLTQTAPELSSTTIVAWNSGTIAWDGAGSSLTAPAEVTHYKAATTGNTMVIKTNHAATPTLKISTSATNPNEGAPAWLKSPALSAPTGSDPKTYTLTYDVAATDGNRACYIHITVGTMTVVTKVNQLFQDPVGLSLTGSISDGMGAGLSGSIPFTSGFVPTLDLSGVSWLTAGNVNISYDSGTTWKLNYTLPANITAYRSGSIKVNAGTDQATVSVTQNVLAPNLKINGTSAPTEVSITIPAGGIETTNLTVTCHSAYTPTWAATAMSSFGTDYTINPVTKLGDGVYNIGYTLKTNSTADRTGYITVTAGSASQRVNFTQAKQSFVPVTNNEANCFIVAPGTPGISFTLEQIQTASKQAELTGTLSAVVLWDDANCIETPGITGSDATATVTIKPKAVQGNALIAIKNGSGTIVWSYHIWVVNINLSNTWNPKNNNGTTVNPKVVFMDRNLGATANTLSVAGRGLFYQWGRKDPFPATDISGFSKTGGPVTDDVARRNPDKFYYYASSPYDWLSTQDSNRWGSGSSKTVNDPCPAGWRVPTSGATTASPWYGLASQTFSTGDSGGFNWNASNAYGAYPAAGRRNYSTGDLYGVGQHGYYWSATVNSTTAYALRFNSGSISPNDSSNRALGFSVRCVQE